MSAAQMFEAYGVFRESILCAAIAGATLGFLGVYVVLRRVVFVSAAVTQSAGLGVALAFFAGIHLGVTIDPMVGATVLALLATFALAIDTSRLRLSRESVVGLVYAASGGIAVLIGDRITQEAHDIHAILFGSAVLVRSVDLTVVAAVAGVLLAVHVWWFRGITFAVFDPITARVHGLPTGLLSFLVLVSVGVMAGVSARALGAMPVFAFSTLPAMASLMLVDRLSVNFALAALIGAAAGVAGFAFAFVTQFPVGASQTATAAAFTAAAFVVALVRRAAATRR
ncbi:MAG: metal ABC transporter permease [Deltaproteobacteria bacterium]|nr:metal ABC transporter permease [Deltaproteobacteria bacterium]